MVVRMFDHVEPVSCCPCVCVSSSFQAGSEALKSPVKIPSAPVSTPPSPVTSPGATSPSLRVLSRSEKPG